MSETNGSKAQRTWVLLIALIAVVAVVWWLMSPGDAEEEAAYEAGVTDQSGGELIVTEPDEAAVPVDLPETEMTNVPAEEGSAR